MSEIKQHDSRYAKKKRGNPGPNAMHAIAELGDDGVWRVNGVPYKAPRPAMYNPSTGRFHDKATGGVAGPKLTG